MRAFSSNYPEHVTLPMPALSPTMTHGTLVRWEVQEGDEVAAGDSIAEVRAAGYPRRACGGASGAGLRVCEASAGAVGPSSPPWSLYGCRRQVATDKASMPFDTTEDGFVAKILVPAGSEDVPVGTVCAVMVDDKDDIAAFANYTPPASAEAAATPEPAADTAPPPPPPAAPAAQPTTSSAPAPTGGRVMASPYARKLAREAGIDISALAGRATGPRSRLVAADVQEYLASPPPAADTAAATAQSAQPTTGAWVCWCERA